MGKRRDEPKTKSCCYCGEATAVTRKQVSAPLSRYPHAPYPTEVPPLCAEARKGWAITRRIRQAVTV